MIILSLVPLIVLCKTAPIITTKISLNNIGKINIQDLSGRLASRLILGSLYGLMPLELHNYGYDQHKTRHLIACIIIGAVFSPLFTHPFMRIPHGLLDYFIIIFVCISA